MPIWFNIKKSEKLNTNNISLLDLMSTCFSERWISATKYPNITSRGPHYNIF